jgi:very-long-chain enoyl-CoA reductase
MSTSVKVTLEFGKGKASQEVNVSASATIRDVKTAVKSAGKGRYGSIHQISLKEGEKRLDDDDKKLSEVAKAPYTLQVKNLGAQIGYRTVFILEYLGPILFVGAFAGVRLGLLGPELQKLVFGESAKGKPLDSVALLAIYCWVGHFAKREFETLFVHKFSRPTMPLFNLFKNCMYYWSFGAVIGYPLSSTGFVAPAPTYVNAGLAIFILSELGNLYCHVKLSLMRPAEGSKKREIPTGFMFDLVACPNYFFEIMSWVGFSIMTFLPASAIFTLVGLYQMQEWAVKKHKEYKKTYETEYTKLKRKAIIPFVY